jgi:predicted transglutaminase-like protease
MNEDTTLHQIYYNTGHPAAYSNVERLYLAVDKRIPKKKIQQWLKKQLAYTLHKPKRKYFDRTPYLIDNIDDQGRLKPKFYCVHLPFSAISYCVWRLIYCGSAFGACVFGTR